MKLDLKKPKDKVFLVTFFRFVVRQCLFWRSRFHERLSYCEFFPLIIYQR